jgi:hypothetical protein
LLERIEPYLPSREVVDVLSENPSDLKQCRCWELVCILWYAQRFLYGASVGQEVSRRED